MTAFTFLVALSFASLSFEIVVSKFLAWVAPHDLVVVPGRDLAVGAVVETWDDRKEFHDTALASSMLMMVIRSWPYARVRKSWTSERDMA
jgi:hypothetical protein